jgi:hypothetical protein
VRQLEAAEIRLKGLAEETGGAVWNPARRVECKPKKNLLIEPPERKKGSDDALDCEAVSKRIVEEIGTEYVISYSSERAAGDTKFHTVKVFSTRPEIKIRARRGVYSNAANPPSPSAP